LRRGSPRTALNRVPEGSSMILTSTLLADLHRLQAQASPPACATASPPSPYAVLADPLEELLEMRYQQHLAQRALQDLFENEALQTLEG